MKLYNRKGEVSSETVGFVAFLIVMLLYTLGCFYCSDRASERKFELKKLELQSRQTTSQPVIKETVK